MHQNDEDEDDDIPALIPCLEGISPSIEQLSDIPAVVNFHNAVDQINGNPLGSVQSVGQKQYPPCPVTILSGFLGAGKTTLVQYILQSPQHGKRIAVIENEFGGDATSGSALSIESMIARDGLTSDSLQDLIELPNGCICCTVKDSLVVTLEQLLNKRTDLDYILIECSGLANPGPIASIFWLDEALESRIQLDGIVTVVDAMHIEKQLQETVEASQQIAYADRILLNKIDLLANETEAERLINVIRSIHPTAAIRPSTFSAVPDLEWILNARCFDVARAQDVMQSQILVQTALPESSCMQCGHMHPVNDPNSYCGVCTPPLSLNGQRHTHTTGVSTVSLRVKGTVHLRKVNQWLASILWPHQDNVLSRDHGLVGNSMPNFDFSTPDAGTRGAIAQQQQIFRLKGVLSVWYDSENEGDEGDLFKIQSDEGALDLRRFLVQGVYDLFDIHACTSPDLYWQREEERCGRLIVIGRCLDGAELQRGFDQCLPYKPSSR
jgi:G3E family GTPase